MFFNLFSIYAVLWYIQIFACGFIFWNDFYYAFFAFQVAFKTGDYQQQVIFIGGLTDGFFATEYVSYC